MSTKKTKNDSDNTDYDSMKVTELKELCKERGLSASGLKGEILKRLRGGSKPSKGKTAKASKKVAPKGKGKKVAQSEDESEPEDNSDDENSSSEEVPKKKTKSVAPKKTKKVPVKEESDEGDSDDDENSSSEEETPKKKTKVVSKAKSSKKSKPGKKVPVKDESEEESEPEETNEDESSEEPEPIKKPASKKSAPKKKKAVVAKEDSDDEDDSDQEEDEASADEERYEEEHVPKGKKATSKKSAPKKKAPVEEESEHLAEDDESSSSEEPPVSKLESLGTKVSKTVVSKKFSSKKSVSKTKVSAVVEEDGSQDVPVEFLELLDTDVDHYYVTPQDLLVTALNAVKQAGGTPNEKTVAAFALISENLRKFGFGKKHSVASAVGKAPLVRGFVKPKPVVKATTKVVEEDGSEENPSEEDAKDEPKALAVDFDKKVQAYRLGDYVYNFNDKSVIGKVSDDRKTIVPIVKSDGAKLLDQDIRFVILGSQAELDSILQENRQSRILRLGDAEEQPEGGDDGKEVPDSGEGDAIVEVENGVNGMVEREAPEITEDKFRRFLEAQATGENKVDYTYIAKNAGLTDMEGQEIMGNFLAYKDKYATVAAETVMKKNVLKSTLGKKAPVANTGRKIIKK